MYNTELSQSYLDFIAPVDPNEYREELAEIEQAELEASRDLEESNNKSILNNY